MRILRKEDLVAKLKIRPSTVDLMEQRGEFPRRIKIGRGNGRAVGWVESEIDSWIAERVAMRDSGKAA